MNVPLRLLGAWLAIWLAFGSLAPVDPHGLAGEPRRLPVPHWRQSLPAAPPAAEAGAEVCDTNLLQDPSFEAYTPNPAWEEHSTNFGTPLCSVAACETDDTYAPRTGAAWAWFGGIVEQETGWLKQAVNIPSGAATLEFYLWIGAVAAGGGADDTLRASIDSTVLFTATAAQAASYDAYTLVSLDASAFADGESHLVTLQADTAGQIIYFHVDDVALCSAAQAGPPTISSFSPASGPVGASIAIHGANLGGATGVFFNGSSASFSIQSSIRINASVPQGAVSGPISVTTPTGTAVSPDNFTVRAPNTGPGTLYLPIVSRPPLVVIPVPPEGLTLNFTGRHLTALAVSESTNKVFIADDNSGSIIVLDGVSNQMLTSIPNVGSSVHHIVVNETYGRVYAVSSPNCCSDNFIPGTGSVVVINLHTYQVIGTIVPGPGDINPNQLYLVGHDEVHDKIYLNNNLGTGVIDAASNTFTLIEDTRWCPLLSRMAINPVSNEIILPCDAFAVRDLQVIHGDTLQLETLEYPAGGFPLDAAANTVENKLYITQVFVPDQSEMGIMVFDRDTGQHVFVGQEDLEPLAYNPLTNQLFAGVQVGEQGGVIDGSTDQLTYVPIEGGGIGAVSVRFATNRAYMANADFTFAVDGASKSVVRQTPTGQPIRGGVVVTSIGINQATGRVYIINDDLTGLLRVFQD